MKRRKSRLLAGLLSTAMLFSVISAPQKVSAATDTSGHWAEASINNWINRGYISGYPDGTFRPNNAISRAEFVTIANKAFGFTSSQGISFSDVNIGYWAYSEIQKGVAAGYVQGDASGTFRPGSAVSRQEAAVMLARLKGYENDEAGAYNYTDRWAMANWAVGAIGAVSRNGIMSGYPNGTFGPQRDLTRAEAVAVLQKMANSSNTFGNTGTITNSNYNMSTNTNNYTPSSSSSSSTINTNASTTSRSNSSYDSYINATVLEGTRMENRTLTGDLVIPRSVGSQNVTLKNVRMKGTLYVEGGGTITLENCNIAKVVMDKPNAVLKNNGSSDVEEVRFEEDGRIDGKGYMNVLIDDDNVDEVIIDADVDTLTLDAEVDLRLYANASIDTFEITKNADRAKIRLGEDSEVTDMQIYDKVRISGKGKIDTMTVYVSGVRSEVQPRRLIQQDGANKPNFNYTDDDDDDDYENLTIDDDDEDFDGDDEDYDRVRIAAEDVTARDFTVHDDLIITSAARDSTIRVEDVTVKGNVYIEGGGDSSVIFEDCTLNGNIYSRKNTSGRYDEAVAIKLRGDTTVKGDISITGDTILESSQKLHKIILNKALSKVFRMEAEAESLVVNYNNEIQLRGSKTIDSIEVASGLTNVRITMNGDKVATFIARSPVTLEGTGSIDRLLTNQTNTISSGITIGETGSVEDGVAANYTITSSVSGGNGSISPLGEQTIANGSSREYSITANSAYHVAAIVVDGRELNLENKLYSGFTYTFNNVKANHEIIVSFAEGAGTDGTGSASNGTNSGDNNNTPSEDGYTISATVNGMGGSVDNEMIVVEEGEDGSITFTANADYHIEDITIDEGTNEEKSLLRISSSNGIYNKVTYTFKNVVKNHTIKATFGDGAGTSEIGILSTDEDTAVLKPSGYKYKVTTLLTDLNGNKLTQNGEGRYYCIAGETIQLLMSKLETDDPNEEYLKTQWAIVNTTTNMNITLTQNDSGTLGTLKTTENDGHAVMLRVQVFDTSKSNISAPVYQSDVIELHVDVPLSENPGLMLSNSDNLYCQSNQYVLSPQNFTYVPAEATAANDRQNIQWQVASYDIDEVEGQSGSVDVRIIDTKTGNGGTVPTLLVTQKYRETNSIAEKTMANPTGEVKIKATIPNGYGKMLDYEKVFTIKFIGTQIIPVADITIPNDQKTKELSGIQEFDLNTIGSTVEIRPENATYQQIEWKIVGGDTDAVKKIAEVKSDGNYNTKLVTTGYPGEITLRPYIKNGKGKDQDFDLINSDTKEEVKITVRVVEPEIKINSADTSKGTDEGDKIILSAQVTNSKDTPYTEIIGWEKTYDLDAEDWKPITVTPAKGSPASDGTYSVEYTIVEDDMNEESSYTPKTVYFRAIVEYDKNIGDPEPEVKLKKASDAISVDCKAQPVKLPDTTLIANQKIIVNNNNECTINGYDKIKLPNKLDNDTPITWAIDSPTDQSVVLMETQGDNQVLVLKGKPNQTIVLKASVTGKGDTTFTIKNSFVGINKNMSKFSVVNKQPATIQYAQLGDKIYFMLGDTSVQPANASYYAYEGEKVSWSWGKLADGKDVADITVNPTEIDGVKCYEFILPDKIENIPVDANGKVYFTATWKYGTLDTQSNLPLALQSNTIPIEIQKQIIPVTGIDFSGTSMGELTPTNGEYSYTITVTDTTPEGKRIIDLNSAIVIPSNATNQQKTWLAEGGNVDPDIASFASNTIVIPKNEKDADDKYKYKSGTFKLNLTVANGLGEGQDYKTSLTITVVRPENPPENTKQGAPQKARANAITTPMENNTEQTNTNEIVNNENNTNEVVNNENTVNQVPSNANNAVQTPNNINQAINNINAITTGVPDENGFVAVADISFNDVAGLNATTNGYTVTSNSNKQVILDLADSTTVVNGVSVHTGTKVYPENATNKTIKWSVAEGTPISLTTAGNVSMIPSGKIGILNTSTNKLTLSSNATGTIVLIATVKNGSGEDIDFVKQITIQVSPQATTTTTTPSINNTTSNTNTTTVNTMPQNTISASTRQVVSVGTTQVGTSSTSSAGTSSSARVNTQMENQRALTSTISNSDVSIEISGECKKGISVPLRAVSKSTGKEYTDVDWEIASEGSTNAKIVNSNRLRATNTGTVTVRAIVYTSSGDRMVCTKDITVTN